MIQRREFITLLAGAATWPLAARAQQSERIRRIGVLMNSAASDSTGQSYVGAFVQSLRKLGWVDGKNLHIDWRWHTGGADQAGTYAEELAALAPEVIFPLLR
jgi:putative tryptophan/tyrosine transport system substrate-binding protein